MNNLFICNSIGKCSECDNCGASKMHEKISCEPCPIVKDARCIPADTHEKKCHPEHFEELLAGNKTAEMRAEDPREFRMNEKLVLREWNPAATCYTGRVIHFQITSVLRGTKWGIIPGYAMLSLQLIKKAA